MIRVDRLSRRFGATTAVDDVSFTVRPGRVVGLLGPNGSGKTTTLRILLGLDPRFEGATTFDDKPLAAYGRPLTVVGALLDARAAHPGRTAFQHLKALALTNGIGNDAIYTAVVDAGLESVLSKRIGTFSLGMLQRLGIAAAMLGEPKHYVFDEPLNGLDTDGIAWFRRLTRQLADDGASVLLSSHLMSEVAHVVDDVVILGRGNVLADTTLTELLADHRTGRVMVRSDDDERLGAELRRRGYVADRIAPDGERTLQVTGADARDIGRAAVDTGLALSALTTERPSLEEVYRSLTDDARDYVSGQ